MRLKYPWQYVWLKLVCLHGESRVLREGEEVLGFPPFWSGSLDDCRAVEKHLVLKNQESVSMAKTTAPATFAKKPTAPAAPTTAGKGKPPAPAAAPPSRQPPKPPVKPAPPPPEPEEPENEEAAEIEAEVETEEEEAAAPAAATDSDELGDLGGDTSTDGTGGEAEDLDDDLEVEIDFTDAETEDDLGRWLCPVGYYHAEVQEVTKQEAKAVEKSPSLVFGYKLLQGIRDDNKEIGKCIGKKLPDYVSLAPAAMFRVNKLAYVLNLAGRDKFGKKVKVNFSRAAGRQLIIEVQHQEYNGKINARIGDVFRISDPTMAKVPKDLEALESIGFPIDKLPKAEQSKGQFDDI